VEYRVGSSGRWAAHQTHNLWQQDDGRPPGAERGKPLDGLGCGLWLCVFCALWSSVCALCSICSCSTYHPHPREPTNHAEALSERGSPLSLLVIAIKTIVVWQIEDTLIVATHHTRPNCICKVPQITICCKVHGACINSLKVMPDIRALNISADG